MPSHPESRKMTEPLHTKDKLAAELRTLGLEEMAASAEKGEYHDFLSPFPFPELKLTKDLSTAATKFEDEEKQAEIMAFRRRVIDGEFDASPSESDDWAESPEGLETFQKLMKE